MEKINDKLKILICCHKECELPPDPDGIFLPIHAGAALSQGGGGSIFNEMTKLMERRAII